MPLIFPVFSSGASVHGSHRPHASLIQAAAAAIGAATFVRKPCGVDKFLDTMAAVLSRPSLWVSAPVCLCVVSEAGVPVRVETEGGSE